MSPLLTQLLGRGEWKASHAEKLNKAIDRFARHVSRYGLIIDVTGSLSNGDITIHTVPRGKGMNK